MSNIDRIKKCLEQVGIIFEVNAEIKDFDLSEYLEESVIFIQFIVAIEEEFDIQFPDEYLNIERLGTISSLALIIESLTKQAY